MNEINGLLGICAKSGNISTGETLINDIRKNDVFLVIIASDASDGTQKKIVNKCKYYNIHYVIGGTIDELSKTIGKNNRVSVGIKNNKLANKILEKIGG